MHEEAAKDFFRGIKCLTVNEMIMATEMIVLGFDMILALICLPSHFLQDC